MRKYRKVFIISLIIALFLTTSPALAASVKKSIDVIFNNINITVNGEVVEADNILYEGTTYVPLKRVAEIFGKKVDYDSATKTAGINDIAAPVVEVVDNGQIKLVALNGERKLLTTEEVAKSIESVVEIISEDNFGNQALGTGVFINDDGYLITNYHVIEGGITFSVTTNETEEGKTYEGNDVEVINFDKSVDLALLKINGISKGMYVTGVKPALGSDVVAIGNPLGLTNTISKGIVSAIRPVEGQTLIQTSASVSPGNSGGPLINMYGEVTGIVVSKVLEGENLNFAIPGEDVLKFIDNSSEDKRRVGEIKFADGKYLGEVYNGKRHGYGQMVWDNGDVYLGYFESGELTGSGTMMYSNGDEYNGDFVLGIKDGHGILYTEEYFYRGEFVDDQKNGMGFQYGYLTNEVYLGWFTDGMYDGEGILYSDISLSESAIFGYFYEGEVYGEYAKTDDNRSMSIYKVINGNSVKIK